MTELEQYVAGLPKAELHLHLEGAVDMDTLCELADHHGMPPPPTDLYAFENFGLFLKAFKTVCDHLQTADDYELITHRLARRLHQAGARHAEIYVAAGVLLWQQKPLEELFEGMDAGYRRGRDEYGVEMRWVFDATRQFGVEAAMEMTRRAAALRDRGVIGIGIGGDENRGAAELFKEVYDYARDRGLRLTAHAGETAGPESIWAAVEVLGSQRIGHGLTAARDPRLMGYLAEKQIPVDVCLTSNVRTGVISGIEDHPLRQFLDAGMHVTLSTDDPSMFQTDLVREYVAAHDRLGLDRTELARLAGNSLRAAFALPSR